MTTSDPRSERVAVVPEARLVELLPALREAGFGLMQLPPADLAPETAAECLTQLAEQVAEYRHNDYEVVLAGDGAWCAELDAALARVGLEPLPRDSTTPSSRRRRAG